MGIKLLALSCLIFVVGGADIHTFLKRFVENERKPTMVVFNGIYWKKNVKVHLMKELSRAGIRSCSSMPRGISLHDHTLLLLTDLNCPGTEEVFKNATRQGLQRLPYRWLVLAGAPVLAGAEVWDHFLVDSDLVVATTNGQGYEMTEFHKPAANRSTILTPRGIYHGVLTDVRPHRELYRRRCDLMGAPVIMANTIQESNTSKYHMLKEDLLELEYDVISKNSWSMAKLGFLMLNATPRAAFNYRFGYLYNGQWTGMIKDLVEYKADMGTNVGMTKARLSMVTYLDTLDNTRARFVFRQPALSLTSNIFSLPFSSGVWIATAISSFVSGLAFCLSQALSGTARSKDGLISETFLLAMGAVSQQGCEVQPRKVPSRIVAWVLFTSLMALHMAYSANIVVLLQAPSTSINNLAQLSNSKLTLASYDVDYNRFVFKGAVVADPVRNKIATKINREKSYYNLNDGVERIRKGMFAFHSLVEPVYRQIEKTFQETEKCDLTEIDYVGLSGMYAPASRSSPYLELLRVALVHLGPVFQSADKIIYELNGSIAMFSSVGLMELRPVMLFMIYGVTLSVAIAGMERLVFHANRCRLCNRQGR